MKKINLKKAMIIVLAAVLALVPAFSVLAETAMETNSEGGRAIIVQEVKLESTGASASITRGGNSFAPAAGVRLAEGDVLRTKGNAVVYLSIDAQMVLRLDYDTEAVIEKATFGQKLVVNVKKGHMFYNVVKQASDAQSLEMMSNNITIAIRGTSGILTFGNGTVQHMLFDGVVEVSDGKTSRIQNPGELLSVNVGPANTLENGVTAKNFTLSEIPATVVEEMKKDADLMARILASVPVSIGAEGAKTYADAAYFLGNIAGVTDAKVFSKSLKAIRETVSDPSEPGPVPGPTPTPCPYADGSKGGELYYILKVNDEPGSYLVHSFRYSNSTKKFEPNGQSHNFSTSVTTHKEGEWVHYHIMDGYLGVCTQNGDSAELPGPTKKFTVSFDMNGYTAETPPADQEVEEGMLATEPSVTVVGHSVDGWYTEAECENKWNFSSDIVTEDITLYAKCSPETMRIWMQDAEGTGGPEYVDLTYGDDLEPLSKLPTNPDPSRIFLGYFEDGTIQYYDSTGNPVSGAEELAWKHSSLTIFAEWDWIN